MQNVRNITGTITLDDGTTSSFLICADEVWRQWGADDTRLGRSIHALELLTGGGIRDLLVREEPTETLACTNCPAVYPVFLGDPDTAMDEILRHLDRRHGVTRPEIAMKNMRRLTAPTVVTL
jgi:hypothetical protein